MQLLETVLEVTVFRFRKRPSLRTGIFLLLAFTLLLCSCTGINKTYFFSTLKYSQICSVFTSFSGLEFGP